MSSNTGHEHWLDLLAVPRTRRHVLKAALAGAALTLPFARPMTARAADDPHACQKGCAYTSHRQFEQGLNTCEKNAQLSALVLGGYGAALGFGITSPAILIASTRWLACQDLALLQQKATMFDCLQPNCPGFDPKGPIGPCAGAPANVHCCPDQSVANGYSLCAQCCSKTGSGCGSGVTECGGG
jgi:hypothetical protein